VNSLKLIFKKYYFFTQNFTQKSLLIESEFFHLKRKVQKILKNVKYIHKARLLKIKFMDA